jgi:hypothetical protein
VATVRVKIGAGTPAPIIPVVIPELSAIKRFALQLHKKKKAWRGDFCGWEAEYNPERQIRPLDSKMTFTPADFCIGESGIWFFSLMWERGENFEPVEFLDDRHLLRKDA